MFTRVIVHCVILLALAPCVALAGAVIPGDEEAKLDLGYLLQTQYRYASLDPTGDDGGHHDFILRRGRLRLAATLTEDIGMFLQTEATAGMNGGATVRLIDAYATLRLTDLAVLYAGEHMAPAGRAILTSPAAFLTIDRPAMTNYNLTWGLNARPQFNTTDFPDSGLDLEGRANVRDIGATLFSLLSADEALHLKSYAGFYEGVEGPGASSPPRFTARVQLNFLDPEPDYFNLGAYLGEKRTVSFGTSVDLQDDFARDRAEGKDVDYFWWEMDFFAELPLGPGSVTTEWLYQVMDLDGAQELQTGAGDRIVLEDARRVEGQGFVVQLGYYLKDLKVQPWAGYESWDTDHPDDAGSFRAARLGANYYLRGHNAKLYAGYELFRAEQDIADTDKRAMHTVLAGVSLYY